MRRISLCLYIIFGVTILFGWIQINGVNLMIMDEALFQADIRISWNGDEGQNCIGVSDTIRESLRQVPRWATSHGGSRMVGNLLMMGFFLIFSILMWNKLGERVAIAYVIVAAIAGGASLATSWACGNWQNLMIYELWDMISWLAAGSAGVAFAIGLVVLVTAPWRSMWGKTIARFRRTPVVIDVTPKA